MDRTTELLHFGHKEFITSQLFLDHNIEAGLDMVHYLQGHLISEQKLHFLIVGYVLWGVSNCYSEFVLKVAIEWGQAVTRMRVRKPKH